MSATPHLDKIALAAGQAEEPSYYDPAELLMSMEGALGAAYLLLASDPDDDGDDDSSTKGDTDDDAGHTSHSLFKKLRKRIGDKAAAAACAKADKKVKASALVGYAHACYVMLSVTQAERDKAKSNNNSLPDGSYPINDVKHLHSAAVLAASKHGDYKAARSLIRRRAKELGVDVTTLPGFGSDSDADDGEKVAASMVALAASAPPEPPLGLEHSGVMNHAAFHGTHKHPHTVVAVHEHPHHHNMDNHHGHHPGVPGNRY